VVQEITYYGAFKLP